MNDLNDIIVFVRVARERSFTRAADALGMPKSTVSERVARLEAKLGVRLLERTTRSLRLTDSGTAYFARVERIVQELDEAEAEVTAAHNTPRGVLRIGSPLLFAQAFLADIVAEYMTTFPETQVEMIVADRPFDVLEEELDVAIHVIGQMDAQIIGRKLGIGERSCVATPSYLAKHGTPEVPRDLVGHACVVMGTTRAVTWTFEKEGQSRAVSLLARYSLTAVELVHRAVLADLGIAILPAFLTQEDRETGRLVRVLGDWAVPETTVHLVYPSHRHLSARVRAFVDLVIERLPGFPSRMMGAHLTASPRSFR
ncbi:MAG: Transcriptional regulator, LysR family [Labilithrix sp.]|nr:Transcriptional regulator, LysR family [Labilithrix sp.]